MADRPRPARRFAAPGPAVLVTVAGCQARTADQPPAAPTPNQPRTDRSEATPSRSPRHSCGRCPWVPVPEAFAVAYVSCA
jgi:hypothetical protein